MLLAYRFPKTRVLALDREKREGFAHYVTQICTKKIGEQLFSVWLLPLKGNQKLIGGNHTFSDFFGREMYILGLPSLLLESQLWVWLCRKSRGEGGEWVWASNARWGNLGMVWGWFGLLRFSPSVFFLFFFFVEFWNLHVQLDQGEGVTGWMIFDQPDKNKHFCSEIRLYKEVWTSSLLSHDQVKWTTFWDDEMGGLLWFGLQNFFAQLSKLNWQDLTNICVGSTPHPYQWKMEVLVGIPS